MMKKISFDAETNKQKLFSRKAIVRSIVVLMLLLFVQGVVAYSTLQLFMALPTSWTSTYDEHEIERKAHKGTVFLIRQKIQNTPQKTIPEILQALQPHFSFPLKYLPNDDELSLDVKEQLQKHDLAYDEYIDTIYAKIDSGGFIKLGQLISSDIDDANISAVFILLALLSIVSALLFFAILYVAFYSLWREARAIRLTAHQLGEGDLTARVPKIRSGLLKMVGHVINDMAMRIELLVGLSTTMLHAMAHEFRTPLARLRFGLTMIEGSSEREKEKLYQGIERDITELEDLIKISLNYFRMNNKNIPTRIQPIAVKKWAEDIINSLEPIKPKTIALTMNIPDIEGYFDPDLAAIAFRNLLENAFKYSHTKAHLHISKEDDALIFEFDDDGPGIPESSREEVFSPFIRLDTGQPNQKEGYGVGLSFVRAIAELHHGSALVLTSPLGGARFVMRFGS